MINGALAGFTATAPMTVAMAALYQLLPRPQQYPLPPERITTTVVEQELLEQRLDQPEHQALTLSSHFLYGAAAGAVYAPLARQIDVDPILKGAVFGLAIWVVSYQGWIPALEIMPPATQQPTERTMLLITAHVVWGAVTGLVFARLQRG